MYRTLPLVLALACTDGPADDKVDPEPVQIISASPAFSARDVELDAVIQVTFDSAIQAELDGEVFTIVPTVAGAYDWDAGTLTASFDPTGPLSADTPYTVVLDATLGLAESVSYNFTTVASSIAPPDPPDSDDPSWRFDTDTVRLSVSGDPLRTWSMSTTAQLRDEPAPGGQRVITESAEHPRLHSGGELLDALFAMAITEVGEASVDQISDGSFGGGTPIDCACFETGELWTWVWTRDTAYAADLGLAMIDPVRTANSLRFKLARPNGGGPLEIVQDTGTGGSWPVSTDRAVWALGARQTLNWLPEVEREAFAADALEAMATTIAADRQHVYDAQDGLYRGEQSFLDWREQSYPSWTATNTVHIAMSKSLSTNVAHLILLQTAADLGQGSHPDAGQWQSWADQLRADIHTGFWQYGQLSALKTTTLDPAPIERLELLGNSLAVLEEVVANRDAEDVVSGYPHGPNGPAVFWPQQPDVPIYHNRGSWPFVTAYGLLAAAKVENPAVYDRDLDTLIRGAALNLSHMENFEFLTLAPWYDDGANSGPVVNSRRQLWSVAGFIGTVLRGMAGIEATPDGLVLNPRISHEAHVAWLDETDVFTLEGLSWRGSGYTLHLELPSTILGGFYVPYRTEVNGVVVEGPITDLPDGSVVTVFLDPARLSGGEITEVDPDQIFAPREPRDLSVTMGDDIVLTWQGSDPSATFTVYKDGAWVADALTEPTWTDTGAPGCYAVEARNALGPSQRTEPQCAWPEGSVMEHDLQSLVQTSGLGTWSTNHGRAHYENWGDATDVLTRHGLTTRFTGRHLLQLDYGNGAGGYTSGIAAGHKRIEVYDESDDRLVAEGSVVLPQRDTWDNWGRSSFLEAHLVADRAYRVEIHHAPNMTVLDHYNTWGGTGGGTEGFHRVNIASLVVLAMEGDAAPFTPAVTFTGTDDLAVHTETNTALGDPLETWSAFGMSQDDEFLYLSLVSRGFEADFAPWMIYLEAGTNLGDAVPSTGIDYDLGVVTEPANLPFTPTHAITARAVTGLGPDGGPWNGVWAMESGAAQQRLRFVEGRDLFLAGDRHTLSVRVPKALLGDATQVRLAAHLLHGEAATPWSDRVPAGHDPAGDGGAWLDMEL